ncbi:MAG: hypothetical protein LUE11_12555 [Clostridia bacterium]|nr:hypothetical protein [Clostridia bacterium]
MISIIFRNLAVIIFLLILLPLLFQSQLVLRSGNQKLLKLRKKQPLLNRLTFSYALPYLPNDRNVFRLMRLACVIGILFLLIFSISCILCAAGIVSELALSGIGYKLCTASAILALFAVVIYRAVMGKKRSQ